MNLFLYLETNNKRIKNYSIEMSLCVCIEWKSFEVVGALNTLYLLFVEGEGSDSGETIDLLDSNKNKKKL